MSRRAVGMLAGALLAAGCQQPRSEPSAFPQEPYTPPVRLAAAEPGALDRLDAPPEDAALAEPPDAAPVAQPPSPAPADEVLAPRGGGRVHVVRRGDTLYGLARQYYGDAARWRDIWNANRARVPHPDRLTVGMKLIIP